MVIDLGDSGGSDPAIAQAKWPFPVRMARGAGSIRDRVAAAAQGSPVLVVDADTLADARLYDFLAAQSGDLVAADGDAILARLGDASRLQPGATTSIRRDPSRRAAPDPGGRFQASSAICAAPCPSICSA